MSFKYRIQMFVFITWFFPQNVDTSYSVSEKYVWKWKNDFFTIWFVYMCHATTITANQIILDI